MLTEALLVQTCMRALFYWCLVEVTMLLSCSLCGLPQGVFSGPVLFKYLLLVLTKFFTGSRLGIPKVVF